MTGNSRGRKAAIGFRAHSGWACAIVLGGPGPDILERSRIILCDPAIEGSKQPFHHVEPVPLEAAERFLERCRRSSDVLASEAISGLAERARVQRLTLAGCGQTAASGRPLPPLKAVLASHSLIHAAEGEFYRDVLDRAAAGAGVKMARLRERELPDWTATRLGITDTALETRLAAWGKALGPPWTADEKLATLAAWLTLLA